MKPCLDEGHHTHIVLYYFFFFLRFYLFTFRGEGKEKEGEKHQCVVASHALPSGDLDHKPGMCPDWELNWRLFGLQARTQSTELCGQGVFILLMSGMQ